MKPYFETDLGALYHGDCLEVMKELDDNSIDLVLTDPPYGLGKRLSDGGGKLKNSPFCVLYKNSNQWDETIPYKIIFDEIFRTSKNQMICGGNYFIEYLKNTRCVIAWDKAQSMQTLSAWEMIWTSFDKPAKIYKKSSTDLNRKHPTQKPVDLGRWCLNNYAKKGNLIFDGFAGSGTFLIACEEMGFRWIGVEREKEYCDIIVERLKSVTPYMF